MFTFVRRLFQMTLFCILIILLIGVGVVYWIWTHREQLTHYQVSCALHEIAPDWNIKLQAADLSTNGKLSLKNLIIGDPVRQTELAHLPEVDVFVDWDLYQRTQQIKVQRVELIRPVIDLHKTADGIWTITKLPPILPKSDTKPQLSIREGTIRISADDPVIGRTVQYELHHIDLDSNLTPENILQLAISADGGDVGKLDARAAYSSKDQTWLVEGELLKLQFGNELVDVALAIMPDFKPQVDQLKNRIQATENKTTFRPVSFHSSQPQPSQQNDDLRTRLDANLNFTISKTTPNAPINLDAKIDLTSGMLDHPRFPMPLHNLKGTIHLNNEALDITNLSAQSGETTLSIAGLFPFENSLLAMGSNTQSDGSVDLASDVRLKQVITGQDNSVLLRVWNVSLTDRLKQTAPQNIQNIMEHLQITGQFDMETRCRVDSTGIHADLQKLTIHNGNAKPKSFPYPIYGIEGTIIQSPESTQPLLIYNLTGMANGRPVILKGSTLRPGPEHVTRLNININSLPIDETFLSALPDPTEDVVRKFHITGLVDIDHELYFPNGTKGGHLQASRSKLKNATMNWEQFPYQIEELFADINLENDIWTFENVTGRHMSTEISASGSVSPLAEDIISQFQIQATHAEFDQSLKTALITSSPDAERKWNSLNPRGHFDASFDVKQLKGVGAIVTIPRLVTRDAEATPQFFPYRWEKIKAILSMENGIVNFESLSAHHGPTSFTARLKLTELKDFWVARFEDVYVGNMIPDEDFVKALPLTLRQVFDTLKITSPFSMSGVFEFKGTYDPVSPALTSAWALKYFVSGMSLDLGVLIENICGEIETQGTMFDNQVEMQGRLKIASLSFMGYPVTNITGPFHVTQNQVIFGSRGTFEPQPANHIPKAIALSDRVQGEIFQGIVSMDAIVNMAQTMEYRSRIELTRASLANWAQFNGYGASQIRGIMNGWLDISGQGMDSNRIAGRGQLWISQAELYELPMFIRMFNLLKFVPPDKTAFNFAFADFGISNSRFNFDQIDFIGTAISMAGSGHIRFDQEMNLNFVSKIPRNQSMIPLVNSIIDTPLLREATEGMVQVHVGGKVKAPIINTYSGVQILNESLKRFANSLNMGANQRMPQYGPPPTFSRPGGR